MVLRKREKDTVEIEVDLETFTQLLQLKKRYMKNSWSDIIKLLIQFHEFVQELKFRIGESTFRKLWLSIMRCEIPIQRVDIELTYPEEEKEEKSRVVEVGVEVPTSQTTQQESIPEYIRDNPWVEVIKNKRY